ncbi:hypothetical protein BaRGS_00039454 [Batillaria attramentaria]|uniref:Peptidase metallopeptidase domain-containing protein n=1 Tax=Batillaria attramentaria TaxID=370345 RepID=A0ABD0J3R8_9CAEN
MCGRCLLLVMALAFVTSSPIEVDVSIVEEPESLVVHGQRAPAYSPQDFTSQAEKEAAERFLRHYGYYRKGKPLTMLDVYDERTGIKTGQQRQERDAKSDAIRMFQSYVGLPQTGQLDRKTLEMMTKHRCGVEDIPDDEQNSEQPSSFSVMHDKWEKSRLTWKLSRPTNKIDRTKQKSVIRAALDEWAQVAPLSFQESQFGDVDIDMLFGARDHGDKYPFDGPSKVLAHAYGPIYSTSIKGDVHFDNDETWTTDNAGHGADLLIVATHELGHSLGLKHSRDPNALMYPYYGTTNALGDDDIRAIQYLYGKRIDQRPTTRRPVTYRPPQTARPVYTTTRPTYTLRPRTTSTPPPPLLTLWDAAFHFDVVIKDVHDARHRNVYTGIMGEDFYRFDQDGLLPGYPTSLHQIYQQAPVKADSVFTNPQTQATYFVKDNQVWRYTNFVLDPEFPRSVDPTHFPETVRFVLPFENGRGQTERMFVFGSTWFWEYNFDDPFPGKPQPYQISLYWREVRNDVNYAVTWSDNNMYFISPNSHVVLTRMRQQVNRNEEDGHPEWLQRVCQQVAINLPHQDSAPSHIMAASLH